MFCLRHGLNLSMVYAKYLLVIICRQEILNLINHIRVKFMIIRVRCVRFPVILTGNLLHFKCRLDEFRLQSVRSVSGPEM